MRRSTVVFSSSVRKTAIQIFVDILHFVIFAYFENKLAAYNSQMKLPLEV